MFRKNQKGKNERISYLQNRRGNVQKAGNRFSFKSAPIMVESDDQYDYSAPETKNNNQIAASNRQVQEFPQFRSASTATITTVTTAENKNKPLKSFNDFSSPTLLASCDCLVIRKEGSFNHTMNASLGSVSMINEQEPFENCTSSKFDLENFQNTLMDLIEQVPVVKSFFSFLEITTKCK